MVNKTGDLKYLLLNNKDKVDNELDNIWVKINDEFINEFGLPDKYLDWLRYKEQAIKLYDEVYNGGEKWKITLAEVAERQADEVMNEGNRQTFSSLTAQVSKYMGFRVDIEKVTVSEFYNYIKLANTK